MWRTIMGILNFFWGYNDSELRQAIAALQQRLSILEIKEQTDMSTLNDAIAKLAADAAANKTATDAELATVTSAVTTITNTVNNLKAAVNSQPDSAALLAQITPMIQTLEDSTASLNQSTANLQQLTATAQADDPGAPVSAPVNS